MISLFSGTPGSGKSLHVAEKIYTRLVTKRNCIANFDINVDSIKHRNADFVKIENWDLTPQILIDYAENNAKRNYKGNIKEGQFLLIIDECQILFNSRETGQKGRLEWCSFFAQHRKYGYDVILVAQFDRMIDRQIRALIEYEYIHRKVSNFGWRGQLLNILMGGKVFSCKQMWYPLKEKVGSNFFKLHKRYANIYDSYKRFGKTEDEGVGAPRAEVVPETQQTNEVQTAPVETLDDSAFTPKEGCQAFFSLTTGQGVEQSKKRTTEL